MNEASPSTPPQSRRCVLFVDDDAAFLESLKELLQTLSDGQWAIITADSAARAFDALKEHPVDLAVIDAQMPVMDGMQMLTLLNRSHPSLQKVVLTGYADESYRAACLRAGAELVLIKPGDRGGWDSIFTVLNELVRHHPEDGFRGMLRRVGLHDVIQMECLSRKSSVLGISNAQAHGQIFFEEGQIVHAQLGELSGEAAFNRLLSMTGGQFNLKPFVEPPARTISGQWEFLLMEAARKVDESVQTEAAPESSSRLDSAQPIFAPKIGDLATTTEAVPLPKAAPVPLLEPARPTVEEVLICSERGDILQEWRCRDVTLWINFFEFLARKVEDVAEAAALGEFDRLEILSGDMRVVVILGPDRRVMIKTQQEGRQKRLFMAVKTAGPTNDKAKERINDWLRAAPPVASTLVRGIRFGDQTFVCDSDTRKQPAKDLEPVWAAVSDTFKALNAHLLPPTRLTWVYAKAVLYYVRRDDDALFGVFITKSKTDEIPEALNRLLIEFRLIGGS